MIKKKLGKYEIIGVLGRGSMGVVYKGVDPQINKVVAIKTMNQKVIEQAEMQERFYREGTILGQLNHRNIISVYAVGQDEEILYIAMEYLEGTSLERLIQRNKTMPLRRSLEIMLQVCEGVYAAHRQSIIHRDIKPANIHLLENDHVKVLDFGVAHFQNSQLTNSGVLLGTINYMAPEQITGLKVDHRADIFSIGVILHELLNGKNPFLGSNISQTMVKLVNHNPEPIAGIPPKLQEVLDRSIHKDREKRYYSCRELARSIDEILRTLDDGGEKKTTVSFAATPTATAWSGGVTTPTPLSTLSSSRAGSVSNPPAKTQNLILQKMIQERIDGIEQSIKKENIEEAQSLMDQLRRLDRNHSALNELNSKLERAKKSKQEKNTFVAQLTHETLAKANEAMADRHFVNAIELCQKILRQDPSNQDARVIKATSVSKIKRYLEQLGET